MSTGKLHHSGELSLRRPEVVIWHLCPFYIKIDASFHGANYACNFCDGRSVLKLGKLCTFYHPNQQRTRYLSDVAKPAITKQFLNVTQPCLTVANPEKLVIDLQLLPELFMGVADVQKGTTVQRMVCIVFNPV